MTDILDVLGGVGAVNDGAAIKAPCRVATTANLTALYGLLTVDGVTLAANDRVLVKDQTTTSDNGIYIVQSGAWARAPDFAVTRGIVQGTVVSINAGTLNIGALFQLTTASPAIGSALAFSQRGGIINISALPTSLPAAAGVLWNNGGVVSIS